MSTSWGGVDREEPTHSRNCGCGHSFPADPGNMLRPESPSGHLCAEGEVALTIAGPHCCLANPGPISRSWLLGVGPQNKRTQPSSARVGRT